MAGLFLLLIVLITTVLMSVIAEMSNTNRAVLTGVISCRNYAGTVLGAAISREQAGAHVCVWGCEIELMVERLRCIDINGN